MKFLVMILTSLSCYTLAAPIGDVVIVNDGLNNTEPTTIEDDYIRLTLVDPGYKNAANLRQSIEDWLGPNMVILRSSSEILVQAPRDSSKRIEFIAALIQLEVDIDAIE